MPEDVEPATTPSPTLAPGLPAFEVSQLAPLRLTPAVGWMDANVITQLQAGQMVTSTGRFVQAMIAEGGGYWVEVDSMQIIHLNEYLSNTFDAVCVNSVT